ncbi:MAG: nucleoside triphosphate pyrophosphohydrolase [Asgard group archaeon]|nr:nucleoside triphosphate pyrophosphohydrolase [Asgard group archaeon]
MTKNDLFDKLVRDKIPEIIRSEGRTPKIRKIENDRVFEEYLTKKLMEETMEFQRSHAIQELADIFEIILSFLSLEEISFTEFEQICAKKRVEKGSFKERLVLKAITD